MTNKEIYEFYLAGENPVELASKLQRLAKTRHEKLTAPDAMWIVMRAISEGNAEAKKNDTK